MAAVLFYLPFAVAAKPTNIGAPGAKAYFYVPSSTTLRPVYATSALTTQRSNPVVADGLGRFAAIYLNNALSYKLVIKDKGGTTLFTADPYVPGTAPDAGSLAPYQAAAEAAAADAEASASDAAALIEAAIAETIAAVDGSVAAAAASALAAAAVFTGTAGAVALPRFTPEMYGAVGNNAALDAPALHSMGVALSALGRGVIDFYPGRTYLVGGGQVLSSGHQAAGYAFPPIYDYVLDINGCTGPAIINMNGATIKCADGVKYGTFNDDGTDKGTPSGSLVGGLATPYYAIIRINNCSGLVKVLNGELNGNIANVTLGGYYGDNGRQIPYSGIYAVDNAIGPIIDGVNSHHHGLDGIIVNGPGNINLRENGVVCNSQFLNNGRGNSFVGGNGWTFENNRFNASGKDIGTMTYTGPGTGFDLEAEGGRWVKNIHFARCEFIDNTSSGASAPVDSSATATTIHFEACKFIGTTSWGCWVYAPYVTFERCLFVGAIVGMYPSTTLPASATKFKDCTFDFNAALTPGGVNPFVNGGIGSVAKFLDFTFGSDGIDFDHCTVLMTVPTATTNTAAQFGTSLTRHIGCTFKDLVGTRLQPFGLFEGQDTLFANCTTIPDDALATARFMTYAGPAFDSYQWSSTTGPFSLARYDATGSRTNGKKVYNASATWNPASVANGAQATTTITLTGVALGDVVEDISSSLDLQGLALRGYVSAANTLTVALSNATGGAVDLGSGTVRAKVRQT